MCQICDLLFITGIYDPGMLPKTWVRSSHSCFCCVTAVKKTLGTYVKVKHFLSGWHSIQNELEIQTLHHSEIVYCSVGSNFLVGINN